MTLRRMMLLVVVVYLVFTIVYVVVAGFEKPRDLIWIGLIGLVILATAATVRGRNRK